MLAPHLPFPRLPDIDPPDVDEGGGAEVQVGAVPFRWRGGQLRVLLVTSRTTKQWICPKGGRMRGLTDRQAAAVEVREEAGVEGYVFPTPLGLYLHRSHDGTRPVLLFALEVLRVRKKWQERGQRQRRWMPLAEAIETVDPALGAVLARLPVALATAR